MSTRKRNQIVDDTIDELLINFQDSSVESDDNFFSNNVDDLAMHLSNDY